MPRINPTAIIDPSAVLADDVEIGPYCVIEGDVRIGPGTVLREGAVIRRYTTLGVGNFVDAYTVLGGTPQDLKFDPRTVSYLRIGDNNVFRENVTISRATTPGNATLVGNKTYWMVGAHAGHDSTVEDECILINGSALAGHTVIGRRAILSAHAAVHQFCWVGQMSMGQGNASAMQHMPPYVLWSGVGDVVGLNTVGMRRAGLTDKDRMEIREAFRLTYSSGLPRIKAVEAMDAHTEWSAAAGVFRDFIKRVLAAVKPYRRGLSHLRKRKTSREEE